MSFSAKELSRLRRIISIAEKLIAEAPVPKRGRPARESRRIRRTGAELVRFRKMLKAERKRGVPAAALAKKYGVSTAYVYMI